MGHAIPWGWKPPPVLYPWQRVILRLVVHHPGASTQELGDRYAPFGNKSTRALSAHYELVILARANLVQRHGDRWFPALMAPVILAQAAQPRQPVGRLTA